MVPVNSCPKNKLDTIKASETLKCGKDKYNNNQYMCLPNKKKSSLMEFCFNGVIGAEEKGMLFWKSNHAYMDMFSQIRINECTLKNDQRQIGCNVLTQIIIKSKIQIDN